MFLKINHGNSFWQPIKVHLRFDADGGVLRFSLVGGVPPETQNPYPYLGVTIPKIGPHF